MLSLDGMQCVAVFGGGTSSAAAVLPAPITVSTTGSTSCGGYIGSGTAPVANVPTASSAASKAAMALSSSLSQLPSTSANISSQHPVLDRPTDLCVSPDGLIYVVDFGASCVRVF